MSSDIAIKVQNVRKCFQVYDKPQDRLKQSLWRGKKRLYREFVALEDVSFQVKKGETVGIVGRNGSGKSTLLQIICGTLNTSSGGVEVNGRVAALLELGAGFNPDFTGRENVFMNASILGLSHEEIVDRFDSVVEFSEIGEFIDQPVKTYSSGMFVRLAFSVAICTDPDILVIDEALAVGDEAFQRKCFARIELMQERGCAILFVSHSAAAVMELCNRAILLADGGLLMDADPKSVIETYQRMLFSSPEDIQEIKDNLLANEAALPSEDTEKKGIKTAEVGQNDRDETLIPSSTVEYTSKGALIRNIRIENQGGDSVNLLTMGEVYFIKYSVSFERASKKVRCGTLIKNVAGLAIGGLQSTPVGKGVDLVGPGETVDYSFPFKCSLLPGTYFINAGVMAVENEEETFLHRIVDAAMFKVKPETDLCADGIINLSLI